MMRLLDRLEEWIIATLMGAATFLIFVAVMHRYGVGTTADLARWSAARGFVTTAAITDAAFVWLAAWDMSWAQELCIYMFVWMAKFGAAYGVRTGIHVGVDVLVNLVGPDQRRRVVLFGLLCGALFTGIIGSLGGVFVFHMFDTGQHSNDL